MVDLAHISPEQKHFIIRGDATCQFIFINHQPININRINQELADKIGEMYNSSVTHERILEMHTPIIEILKTTDIDNISPESITAIIKNLIKYDYTMFLDIMTVLAAMLEAKDVEKKSNYIDSIVECSDLITAFSNSSTKAVVDTPIIENSITELTEDATIKDKNSISDHITESD